MKNADTPAMPLALDIRVDEGGNQFCNDAYEGLSKREHFAGLAMQGMLASKYSGEFMSEINDDAYDRPNGLANNAIRYADALLKQLGEQNEQN